MKERHGNLWLKSDDKQTVNEMLNDPYCSHWNECRQFFEHIVILSRLPVDMHEDVVQNALISVISYLPTFRFNCKFSTWLMFIARSRIADAMRQLTRAKDTLILGDLPDGDGNEIDLPAPQNPLSPEEICIVREKVEEAVLAMSEYCSKHTNRERNLRILLLRFFEQYTVAEIAKELHMKEPTVRAVISTFKRFLEQSDKQEFH